MRDLTNLPGRIPLPKIYGKEELYDKHRNGAFIVEHEGATIRVIASSGGMWDHVSVSLADRCPTWAEMDFIKRMFFKDDEVAFQLHVPVKDHINIHPFTLHLWRPHLRKIPLPPKGHV